MVVFTQDLINPQVIFLIIFGYLLGSIPVGLFLSSWLKGVDPRHIGSGNIGATNVTRAAGFSVGLLTFFFDLLKGSIPVLFAWALELSLETQAVVGFFAFLGHCFPIWLYFKGGKGVATGFGVLLILFPSLAAIALFAFSLGYGMSKQVAVGSVVAAFNVLLGCFFLVMNGFVAAILVMMVLIMILRHQNNIKGFLRGRKEGL